MKEVLYIAHEVNNAPSDAHSTDVLAEVSAVVAVNPSNVAMKNRGSVPPSAREVVTTEVPDTSGRDIICPSNEILYLLGISNETSPIGSQAVAFVGSLKKGGFEEFK